LVFCCRSESDIPVAAPVDTIDTDQLEQAAKKEEVVTPQSSEEQGGCATDSTAVAADTSFSVDELATKLRKSLTLDDQPQNESFAAVEQEAVATDLESNTAQVLSEEHPADDSSAFFDCENKSFAENISPVTVVEPALDVVDNHVPAQSEMNVPETLQPGETDDKPDSDSLEVVEKMADNLDLPKSPPIAAMKGSYSINWDELDENSDPCMLPTKRLASSLSKSPVLPACVGSGDGSAVDDVDPFKLSRRLADSPPAAVAVNDGSAVKQTQRRSINNNLPEPVTDDIVSSAADNVAGSDATNGVSLDAENKTPSKEGDKRSEVKQDKSATSGPETVE